MKKEKANVLVIGNSGVGKSTLINAVMGETMAATGGGTEGTTKNLAIYENDSIDFRIIDTIGFEPTYFKEKQAIDAVKKWSKDCALKGHENNQINLIWFCVEGTSKKLFPKAIKSLSKATSIWKTVPVIVVITKSYSAPDREENIKLVQHAFATQKHYSVNLRKIIPVVADTYVLNETSAAPPEGIDELIDITYECIPDGLKAAENDINAFKLSRKRVFSQSVIGAFTAAGTVVGATPIPFADATLLVPIETAEINALAKIYGIGKGEDSKIFINSIIEVGTVSIAAKAAISAVKAIPGVNIVADVLNAIIAGAFVVAIGEGAVYAFEQVYLGNKTLSDIDWVRKIIESRLSSDFIDKVKKIVETVAKNPTKENVAKVIAMFAKNNKQ